MQVNIFGTYTYTDLIKLGVNASAGVGVGWGLYHSGEGVKKLINERVITPLIKNMIVPVTVLVVREIALRGIDSYNNSYYSPQAPLLNVANQISYEDEFELARLFQELLPVDFSDGGRVFDLSI